MKIIVGSTNQAKVQAVRNFFQDQRVQSVAAPSKVSAQPLSDTETRQGAMNRAMYAQQSVGEHGVGIGLEGGIMQLGDDTYLCNWGALVLPTGELFTASGVRIFLPKSVATELRSGAELGDIMARWTKNKNVRQQAGAIGVLTNGAFSRQEMYIHIVKLLWGQWEFHQNDFEID